MIEESLRDALAVRRITPPIQPPVDHWRQVRRKFDARLYPQLTVSDELDRMIRDGSFDRQGEAG